MLTPTWDETTYFADLVLPMGLSSERHNVTSYEQYDGQWVSFRQPMLREARQRLGETITDTRQVNPGDVWEENEFWIELSWHTSTPTGRWATAATSSRASARVGSWASTSTTAGFENWMAKTHRPDDLAQRSAPAPLADPSAQAHAGGVPDQPTGRAAMSRPELLRTLTALAQPPTPDDGGHGVPVGR